MFWFTVPHVSAKLSVSVLLHLLKPEPLFIFRLHCALMCYGFKQHDTYPNDNEYRGHLSPLGMAVTSSKVLISSFLKWCTVNDGHIMAFFSVPIHFGKWFNISLYFKMGVVDFLLAAPHLCLFKYWGSFNQGIHKWRMLGCWAHCQLLRWLTLTGSL